MWHEWEQWVVDRKTEYEENTLTIAANLDWCPAEDGNLFCHIHGGNFCSAGYCLQIKTNDKYSVDVANNKHVLRVSKLTGDWVGPDCNKFQTNDLQVS